VNLRIAKVLGLTIPDAFFNETEPNLAFHWDIDPV